MSGVLQAIQAISAALQQAPVVSEQVHRARVRPLPAGWKTAVVVRPVRSDAVDPQPLAGGVVRWDCLFEVECYVRASSDADTALDALTAAVYGRLMADQRLGGAVQFLIPGSISFEFDIDGEATACAAIQFTARLVTAPTIL